jgi:hypothetical protein
VRGETRWTIATREQNSPSRYSGRYFHQNDELVCFVNTLLQLAALDKWPLIWRAEDTTYVILKVNLHREANNRVRERSMYLF